MTYQDVA